jgi:peptide/nickel transport system substrate-binding protein
VLQAIYDGPLEVRAYRYQPVILEHLPSLDNGEARIEPVNLKEGDRYLNPITLEPENLAAGKPYLPSGCRSAECIATYQGGEVSVDRLVVTFQLREGILWSDGEPLTASDSVFSFQVDADPATPSTKFLVLRTESYQALDALHTQWTGIPGFLDPEYPGNFWSPLPRHQLADFEVPDLLSAPQTNRAPLGWGPYVIERWEEGQAIYLRRNPLYFRAPQGLPGFDLLTFRFLDPSDDAWAQLASGECDVLDEHLISAPLPPGAEELLDGQVVRLVSSQGSLVTRLDFNLAPVEGAPLLDSLELRRALAACIDRQALAEMMGGDQAQLAESFLPQGHPLFTPVPLPTYDPEAAREALERLGWALPEEGGPRVSRGVSGLPMGVPLRLRLALADEPFMQSLAENLQADLAECGVALEIETYPGGQLFEPWPQGPVFGRTFQMVLWSWPTFVTPACEMFAGFDVPSSEVRFGVNASGMADPAYDTACRTTLLAPAEMEEVSEAARRAQTMVGQNLAALPLLVRPRLVAVRQGICGAAPDPSTFSALWNLEEFFPAEECPPADSP